MCSLGLVGVGACSRAPAAEHKEPIRVAAAADLSVAFTELGRRFEARTGQPVSFTFGSTGQAAKQLREGAPFDLFAAAAVSYVDDVVRAGACDGETKALYARGRLALWARSGAEVPRTIAELADPRFRRIALANPQHAPYGLAAKQALIKAGLWDQLQPRLVYAENVRQSLQLAESGNVEVAFVALALVLQQPNSGWALVDEQLHEPLEQALVVCGRGRNANGAREFAAFVGSQEGRELLKRHGFARPGELLTRAP